MTEDTKVLSDREKQHKAELVLKYGDQIVEKEIRKLMRPKEEGLDKATAEMEQVRRKQTVVNNSLNAALIAQIKDHVKTVVDKDAVNEVLKPAGIVISRIETYGDRFEYRLDYQTKTVMYSPQLVTKNEYYIVGTSITLLLSPKCLALMEEQQVMSVEINKVFALVNELQRQTDSKARQRLRDDLKDRMTDNVLEFLNGDFQPLLPAAPKE